MVSSSICGSCAAHSGWMLAVAPSARTAARRRGGRPAGGPGGAGCRARPLARAGRLDGVQRLAHRPVAERVEVHLEAERVQRGDVAAQLRPGRRRRARGWRWRSRSRPGTGSSIAAVKFSATPSCMIFTVSQRSRPTVRRLAPARPARGSARRRAHGPTTARRRRVRSASRSRAAVR